MPIEFGWAFDGVNQTIPRNAGPDCAHYLTWQRQIIECIVVSSIFLILLRWTWKRLHPCPDATEEHLGILQQRLFYGNLTSSSGGGVIVLGGGGLAVQRMKGTGTTTQLERNCGYFGNSQPPPLLLQNESDKNNLLLFNDVTAATGANCDKNIRGGGGGQFNLTTSDNFIRTGGQSLNNTAMTAAGYGPDNVPLDGSGRRTTAALQSHVNCHQQQQQQQWRQLDSECCEAMGGGGAGEAVRRPPQMIANNSNNVILCDNNLLVGKQVLLVLMTFVLGLELGFKFASRTVIYLLNPCHITTIMQV